MTQRFIILSIPFILIFAAISFLEPYLYHTFFANHKVNDLKGHQFVIIAHRGASGVAPENTIYAIKEALKLKVDFIAIDVHMTKDEKIVVFHDEDLERTTDGSGKVYEKTLDELKSLDAGSWFDSKFSDARIATLEEIIDLVNGQAKLLIEIKTPKEHEYHGIAKHIVDIIQYKNAFNWCIVESYSYELLEEAQAENPKVIAKKLIVGEEANSWFSYYVDTRKHLSSNKREDKFEALTPPYQSLSVRRIFQMHARGYKVYTFTLNTKDDMVIMLNMGVDGIVTDFPEVALQLRNEINNL